MNYLYLISEDDNDDLFFEACLERLTGLSFQLDQTRLRNRKRGGIAAARQLLRSTLRDVKRFGKQDNIYVVVAVDNDRCPEHPYHERIDGVDEYERSRGCRVCELNQMIEEELGADKRQWPVAIAITVPVQMLETWLLLITGHDAKGLPYFKRKRQPAAQKFYSPKAVPDQLEELCKIEIRKSLVKSMGEFCLMCATERLEPDDLARKSPSFAYFKSQVESWI